MLKQRLATGDYCNGKTKQRFIDGRKDELGLTNVFHSKTAKSHFSVEESF